MQLPSTFLCMFPVEAAQGPIDGPHVIGCEGLTNRIFGVLSKIEMTTIATLVEEPRDDYITCVRYDYFGRRVATVSADAVLRVRDIDDNGMWSVQDGCEIKNTHAGTVWKVDWAHPDFGQLLATCSQDCIVRIWEEHSVSRTLRDSPRWLCVASLPESRYGICDVKFAPRHLGLRIAAASEDGKVRIYKASDPTHPSTWFHEKAFEPCPASSSVSCISWCQSPFEKPLIAVGTMSGLVQVWSNGGNEEVLGEWAKVLDLPGHDSLAVSGVDWANAMGRSSHRIASCGADDQLLVHVVTSPRKLDGDKWRHDITHRLMDREKIEPGASPWQVQWNVTGTTLVTGGDDGALRFWGKNHDGTWACFDVAYEASLDKKPLPAPGELNPDASNPAVGPLAVHTGDG